MHGLERIESVWAWVCTDKDDNTEGIPAFDMGGKPMPMMSSRKDLIMKMRPVAEQLQRQGHKMALVEFAARITHDTIGEED